MKHPAVAKRVQQSDHLTLPEHAVWSRQALTGHSVRPCVWLVGAAGLEMFRQLHTPDPAVAGLITTTTTALVDVSCDEASWLEVEIQALTKT